MKLYKISIKDNESVFDKFKNLANSFVNMINSFDKLHHNELQQMLSQLSEEEISDVLSGPEVGQNTLFAYLKQNFKDTDNVSYMGDK